MAVRDVGQLFPDQRPDHLASRQSSQQRPLVLGLIDFFNTLKVFDAAERDLPTKQLELAGRIACTFLRRA